MRLPGDDQRLACIGRTGSGKTQAMAWHLSKRNFDAMPWIVYDFKRDKMLNRIEGAEVITLDVVPEDPGIYLVQPLPSQEEELEQHFWTIWEHERIGVYVDEGYMVGAGNPAFRALLTQGRSKRIPMIVGIQRPVMVDRFLLSESDFFQVFSITDDRDIRTLQGVIDANLSRRLPRYHSYYYDVGANELNVWKPVPSEQEILNTFAERLREEPEQPRSEEGLRLRVI